MVVAICLSALFWTTIDATAWQQRSCVINSNVACFRKSCHLDEAASPRDGGSELGGLCRLGGDWPPRDSGVIPWYFRPCGWNSLVPTYERVSRCQNSATV